MQQRRLRPGDVLDDYCPRERRITDHAIVAMIDDNIKQTRCVVCDAEHEFKQGKIPAQRRKRAGAGLFGQVLEGLQPARLTAHADHGEPGDVETLDADPVDGADDELEDMEPLAAGPVLTTAETVDVEPSPQVAASLAANDSDEQPIRDDGPVRRPLIRATLPRPEGQAPPTRAIPEFTIRQPNNARGARHGRRRAGGAGNGAGNNHHGHGQHGAPRFGRGPGGQRQGGPRQHGANGGRPRRGGKKR